MAKKKSKKQVKKSSGNGSGASATATAGVPRQLRPHEVVLAAANAVEDVMVDFPVFASFARNGVTARVESKHAAQLDDSTKDAIVALFEANMKHQYEGSDWGYDAGAKKHELFESDARYLLALDVEDCGALLGFVHFRFVADDDVEVLYVYEIQIAERAQRRGLGKFLMQILLLVARKQRMKLVVLTVFKTNVGALAFYREKMGFATDETSPGACGDQTQSYEILSKAIDPAFK